jgi:hypothetical protein
MAVYERDAKYGDRELYEVMRATAVKLMGDEATPDQLHGAMTLVLGNLSKMTEDWSEAMSADGFTGPQQLKLLHALRLSCAIIAQEILVEQEVTK